MNVVDEAVRAMESQVADLGFLDSLGEAAQVSIAISLKRIADALDATPNTPDMEKVKP